MKGQLVVDFIFNQAMVDMVQVFIGLKPWKLYFDGYRHKNGTCIGILIISLKEIPTNFKFKVIVYCSNNEVEYEVLIAYLKNLLDLEAKVVEIRGGLELIVKQPKNNTNVSMRI